MSLFQGFVEVCVDSAGPLISNMSTVAIQSKAEELESFHHNSHTHILLGLTKPADKLMKTQSAKGSKKLPMLKFAYIIL